MTASPGGFGPMDIPGGSGPSLQPDKPWYKRGFMWFVVAAVAIGALVSVLTR